jgi:hypothetical protein
MASVKHRARRHLQHKTTPAVPFRSWKVDRQFVPTTSSIQLYIEGLKDCFKKGSHNRFVYRLLLFQSDQVYFRRHYFSLAAKTIEQG